MLEQAARPGSVGGGQAAHSDGGYVLVLGPREKKHSHEAEMRSIVSLMPRYLVAEAGAGATDPGADRGGGGSGW